MNRYVFTIVLALAGIIGISLFYGYVNETVAAPEDFKIETVAGDEKEMEHVSLAGMLYAQNIPYSILLSQNQTELNTDSAINWMHTASVYSASDIRIKELQKEYRSFMRGKENPYQLYEDEDFLVYGELDVKKVADEKYEGDIHLSFFDKAKKEGKDFVLSLPKELGEYSYLNISDVQLLEQEVVLMFQAEQNEVSAVWRVAVNINQEKVVEHTLIHEMDSVGSNYMSVGNDSLTKEKYMPISEMRDEEQDDGTILTAERLFVVNVENGELLEINFPDKTEYNIQVNDESIYYIEYGEGAVYTYNFTKKVFEPLWKHDTLTNGNILWAIKGDRTYLLENGSDNLEERTAGDIHFYVLHTDSGQELYHGRIAGVGENTDINFTTIYPK
ncbi:MAG: hypothetical protein ACI4XS_12060 [Bacillus sp. (in: firmicutes)]